MAVKTRNPKTISISNDEKLVLVGNLGTMLTSGISIIESVESLAEDAKGSLRTVLLTLKTDLEQGRQVHESLGQFSRIFDGVTTNIIKAAEESGTLDKALKDLRDTLMKETEFRDKIKGAMMYPVFILFVFVFVLVGMLYGIIPRIGGVFKSLRIPLPLVTRILIAMSDILVNNTLAVIGCVVIFVALLILLYRYQKKLILKFVFGLPVISGLVRDIDLTRFTRSMSLLLLSGIPITGALELSMNMVIKPQVKEAIQDGYQAVLQGGRLSEGIGRRGKLFPGILRKMIEVGEKSGSLDKSLQDASDFLDYQTSKKIKELTTLLEPLMLVLVAGLVGGMMLAIIAPIYGLISSIGSR